MGNKEEEKKKDEQKVAFHRLFAFADARDMLLMAVGTVTAVGNGMSMPLMTLIFGEIIDAFGYADTNTVLHKVTQVSQDWEVRSKCLYKLLGNNFCLGTLICPRRSILKLQDVGLSMNPPAAIYATLLFV